MIKNVDLIDLANFEKKLKLPRGYTKSKLKYNFARFSTRYHPRSRIGKKSIFRDVVIMYEVLNYLYPISKQENLEKTLLQWNYEELPKVDEKIIEYASLSVKKYVKAIENTPLGAKIMIMLVKIVIVFALLIMVLSFMSEVIAGHLTIIGVVLFSLSIFGAFFGILREMKS